MSSAAEYPITFGYKATDSYYYGPNGTVGKYHRGNDRPCPTGTAINIGSTTIGLTGATGLASGPHLHTQACSAGANYADDFNPAPYEFKYGTVVKAGWHSQFGNHIVIRTNGVDLTYAHLSKINVSVGQVLSAPQSTGGTEVFQNDNEVKQAYLMLRGNEGTAGERAGWIGQPKQRFFQLGKAEADGYRKQLADVKTALANEQKKPPKEVVKIVEKIVDRPVEVIKEVKVGEDEAVKSFFNRLTDKLIFWSKK